MRQRAAYSALECLNYQFSERRCCFLLVYFLIYRIVTQWLSELLQTRFLCATLPESADLNSRLETSVMYMRIVVTSSAATQIYCIQFSFSFAAHIRERCRPTHEQQSLINNHHHISIILKCVIFSATLVGIVEKSCLSISGRWS